VIDLRTGELRAGRPDDLISKVSTMEFKGIYEPAPKWKNALEEIFQKDIAFASESDDGRRFSPPRVKWLYLTGHIFEIQFNSNGVYRIVPIKKSRLDTWLNQDWVSLSIQGGQGTGSSNQYCLNDLYTIAAFQLDYQR